MAVNINQAIASAQNHLDPRQRTLPTLMPTAQPRSESVSATPNENLLSLCPNCGGQRYIRFDVPIDHPSFGRLFPCRLCNKSETASSTGLNPLEREIGFDDIDTQGRPGAARMLEAAREFIVNGRVGFLTIHGNYGNAKTTLLMALVNDCIAHDISTRYITMTEVMVYAREAFENEQQGDTDYGRIAQLAKVQVLVIDELDKARVSDYAREVQTHLFNVRYRNSHVLGTVVAWNGGFHTIDLPWVISRLSQFIVVENNDADMRPLLGEKL